MANRAARTAWGPIIQVALEQWAPQDRRIVHDDVVYRLLPAYLKAPVALCRLDPLRNAILTVLDRMVPGIRGGILCRKRYIDDRLEEAVKGGIQTVVNLGAGFDTRAYRLPESLSINVYEVDLPQTIQAKRQALVGVFGQVPEHVALVPIDFDRQDLAGALRKAGYYGAQRTFFIWEGVTQYLSEGAVQNVFGFLQAAPADSQLVFSFVRKDFVVGEKMYGLEVLYHRTRVKKELWKFGLAPASVGTFLSQYAWKEVEQVGSADYQERYLKPVGRKMPVMDIERMVHAERVL